MILTKEKQSILNSIELNKEQLEEASDELSRIYYMDQIAYHRNLLNNIQ